MADVRHYLAQRPELLVGVVQKGAPEMWSLVRPELVKLRAHGVIAKCCDWAGEGLCDRSSVIRTRPSRWRARLAGYVAYGSCRTQVIE